jgi:hypothetical protein
MAAPEVYCAGSDSNLDFKLTLGFSMRGGQAAAPGSLKGSLDIHHQKMPRDRRSWTLDGRTPVQYWNAGGDLRLRLFLEAGEITVDLIIETRKRPNVDGDYPGAFRLETSEGVRVTGRAECAAG